MAKRRLLPALRGLESKSIIFSGGGGGRSIIPSTVTTYGGRDRAAGWDMDTVIEDGYERVVWVFKAVEVIAGNASRLPFKITSEDNEDVDDHPLLRVMNKQANPLENGRAFRKRLSAQILLSKRGAFVEVTKNNAGQISRLDLLDPSRVRIVPDMSGDYISYYEFTRHDGEVRNLPPERVRWIREPHPLDPFSGVTPLEAAGMSAELDHLARAYNVSFINRDGRPGGILGVDADGLDEDELDRINTRLKPGAQYAGQIAAIGTGPGGMTYIDTASKPRDMAYETTSEKSKKEILAAFGVPESLAGNASERTFDNAEQEEYNFWHDPMLPHLDLIAAAFDGDVDDDLDCGYDTTGVEALELPARRRREERRAEWREGLITIKEYREAAEYDEIDNAHTRALWISPSKAPVPDNDEDAVALGLAEAPAGDPAAVDPAVEAMGAAPEAQTAQEVVEQALAEGAVLDPDADQAALLGPAAAVVDAAKRETMTPEAGEAAAAVAAAKLEGKSLDSPNTETYDPAQDETQRVELAVAAALDALLARQSGVITARLESPKTRRGTRFWVAAGDTDARTGTDPIDVERVVDAARWVGEAQETLLPIAAPAATEAARNLLTAMATTGALTVGMGATAQVAGRTVEAPKATVEQIGQAAQQASAAPTMLALTVAQGALLDWLHDRIADLDLYLIEHQPTMAELIAQVTRIWSEKARPLIDSLAVTIAQTVVLGGRDAAVETLVPDVAAPAVGMGPMYETPARVDRFWVTRHDERVRDSHVAADGQLRMVGESFDVGGWPVRFPCDPLAPPSVARNCRCWLKYQWPSDATFRVTTVE